MKTAKVLPAEEKLAYNSSECAARLGIGLSKMNNLLHVSGFPALKVGGRYLIPKQALQRWLDSRAEDKQESR